MDSSDIIRVNILLYVILSFIGTSRLLRGVHVGILRGRLDLALQSKTIA